MSWNHPEETTFIRSVVKTNKMFCTHCGSKIKKGETAIFVLDDKNRFMSCYHEECSDYDDSDELNFHNVEDGMIG